MGLSYDKGELTRSWEIEAGRTREEDRRDYERELAGIDIGRDARFLGTEFVEDRRQGRSGASNAQRSAQQQYASRLQAMLANDRAYREAHERAMAAFTNAGNAIDRAIIAGEKLLEKARREIDDYLGSTARLSDGRFVMIDESGEYRDETGAPISAEDISELHDQPIKAFAPYEALIERRSDVERDLAELRGWSVEVGDMHNSATDDEAPASRESLDDMAERAERYQQRAEDTLARWSNETAMPDAHDPAIQQERAATLSIPTM